MTEPLATCYIEWMKRIGLTGGIASGKSLAARMLRERGVPVVDADALAREAVEPGSPALQAIAARWPDVVHDDVLDRKALGAVVFSDEVQRKELEGILHPWIRRESFRRMDELLQGGASVVVYEAPLLFENRVESELDAVILVAAPEPLQVSRIMARDHVSEEVAHSRIAAQWPLEKKRAKATFIIENDGDIATLMRRVEETWEKIQAKDSKPS